MGIEVLASGDARLLWKDSFSKGAAVGQQTSAADRCLIFLRTISAFGNSSSTVIALKALCRFVLPSVLSRMRLR